MVVIAFLQFCAGGPILRAQDAPGTRGPAETVAAFFRAFAAQRWWEAAALLDLTPLEFYRREMAGVYRGPGREPTIEDLLQSDPEMPRAVAEYELKRLKRIPQTDMSDYLSRQFADVRSPAQLDSLSIEEVALRWLEAAHPEWFIREEMRRLKCPPVALPDSALRSLRYDVYGAVFTKDSSAYVLFSEREIALARRNYYGMSPQVAHVVRTRAGWQILARSDLLRRPNVMLSLAECPRR